MSRQPSSMRPLNPLNALACASLLATLAAPALAQSNVTVSGTLDVGVYRGMDQTTQVGNLSRSNLAFSGKEDLGGGLFTTFRLSTRMEVDTGATESGGKPFWHDEATVGLKGDFGHVRLGRANDAVAANDWAFDPWDNFDRLGSPAWQYWHYNYATDRASNNGSPEYNRLNNGIFYDSPTVGGASVSLSGSPEKASASSATGQGKPVQGALKYGIGGFYGMVAYGRNAAGDTVKFLGLKYGFGALTVMGAYDISTYQGTLVTSTAHAATLGATYQLDKVLLQAGYGRLNQVTGDEQYFALGARYPLSKRTYVYTDLAHKRPESGSSHTGYGVGINHSF
ncbi:porin [Aquabacterium sp.]|uniref:porin n=1 Tax=Aquabacterium sp. TaxID=1872578 RepID=UPI0025C5644A|nr:porin [Aquabacterium sp.]